MRIAALRAASIFLICLLPLGAGLFSTRTSLPPYVDAAAPGDSSCRSILAPPSAPEGLVSGHGRPQDFPISLDEHRRCALALFSLRRADHSARRARALDNPPVRRSRAEPDAWFRSGRGGDPRGHLGVSRSLEIELRRQYFPWCADSIAIPIFGAWVGGMIMLVTFLVAGVVVSTVFRSLPAPLVFSGTLQALAALPGSGPAPPDWWLAR